MLQLIKRCTEYVLGYKEYCWEAYDEHVKYFIVREENIGYIRVLEKNGYEKEGVLRYYPFGREFNNVVMMSIIDKGE